MRHRTFLAFVPLLFALLASQAPAYHKIVVLDKSGSMRDPDVEGSTISRYEKAKSLVLEEIGFDLASGRNRVSLLFFDHNVYTALTVRSLAEARLALDGHPPQGETNIGDTLHSLLTLLIDDSDELYFAVSLYTDGEEKLTDAGRQKVSIPRARQAFVDFFGTAKRRLFVSIYHHRWNSQSNKDFAELLESVRRETATNSNVTIWIEENPDPTKRVRFVGVFPTLAAERVFVERPREGANVEVDLGLSFEATDLAVDNHLAFRVRPEWKSPEEVEVKIDGPADLTIDQASGTRTFRLVLHGIEKLADDREYPMLLRLELDPARTDDLFVKKVAAREYVLRLVPPDLFFQFRVTPTPFFALVVPREGKIEDSAKVGRTVYHPVRIAWNEAAAGSRIEWRFEGPQGVSLVDAAREEVPSSFELAAGKGVGDFYLAGTLREAAPLSGTLVLSGTGSLSGIAQRISVTLAPRVGSLAISFPDTEPRKVFPGETVSAPLSIQVLADADSAGERFRIAARAQEGVTLKVLDSFGRDVTGALQEVPDAGLLPFGLSLFLDPATDPARFDPAANRIEFLPEHPGRLKFHGPGGEEASQFPFPFPVVAPQKDFEATRAEGPGTVLLKARGKEEKGALRVVWTEDANRSPFEMAVVVSIDDPSGGGTDGVQFSLDGSPALERTKPLGGSQPARWDAPWTLSTTRPGEWIVEIEFAAKELGERQSVRIPVRSVVGEVGLRAAIASTQAVPPAAWKGIGTVTLAATNPFAGGESVRYEIRSAPGIEARLLDRDGRPVEGALLPCPKEDGARLDFRVEVRESYDALKAGAHAAGNHVRFFPSAPTLVLSGPRDDDGEVTIDLAWTPDRPVLAHRTGDELSEEVDLGEYRPSERREFLGEKEMAFTLEAPAAVRERVLAEVVRLEWAEWDRTNFIEDVVFAATGKRSATVGELLKNGRIELRFHEDVSPALLTDQPVYVEVSLATGAPIRIENPTPITLRATVPSRLTAVSALLALGALVAIVFGAVQLLGARAGKGLAGGLAQAGADPIRLAGMGEAFLSVAGDRLAVSDRRSSDSWARVFPHKGKPWIEPLAGSLVVGGRPVELRAELADGVSIEIGLVRVTYVARPEERGLAEVELAPTRRRPRPEDEEGIGIDLGGAAKPPGAVPQERATEEKSEPASEGPPPPPDEDEEGIRL